MHTIPTLGKEWRVSLEFKPSDYSLSVWSNLLHLTLGDNGDRTPSVQFHPDVGMAIFSAVSGNKSFTTFIMDDRPLVGEWTSLEISQEKEGENFVYKIVIGDKMVFSVENNQTEEMNDVKVYASDPWHPTQPGSIKSLLIQTNLGRFYLMVLLSY